jgi:hypothetical protein
MTLQRWDGAKNLSKSSEKAVQPRLNADSG